MNKSSPAIKRMLSPAMRRQMKAIKAQTHFLLLLRPGVAIVDFIAEDSNQSSLAEIAQVRDAMNDAFRSKWEQIAALPADYLRSLSDSGQLFRLCYEIVTEAQFLIPETKLTDDYIHAVAVEWLEEEPLPLGDAPIAGETADPWRLTPANQAQLRFQDAVDWYALHHCSIAAAQFSEPVSRFAGCEGVGVGGASSSIVLKIPTPASRDRIVSLSNLKLFVAEHLLAYDRYAAALQGEGDNDNPELTFFFLPIKGVGQVRAAINWVGVNTRGLTENIHRILSAQATELQRSALESLFTQSLIRGFGIALREALRERRGDDSNDHLSLHHAFAELWWANHVWFYQKGKFQIGLVRAEDVTATTWDSSTSESAPHPFHGDATSDFVSISGEGHPGLSFIRLSLSALSAHSKQCPTVQQQLAVAGLSQEDLERTFRSIPFDDVVFACHFFQPEKEDIDEWKGQLAETAISALIDQTIQHTSVVRSKTKALEGVAHWLNSLVRMAGRARAARTVQRLLKTLQPDDSLREPLRQVLDSLQLLTLLEAGTGALRVSGAMGERNPGGKFKDWFTPTSLAEWERPEAFEKYQKSLTHLIRAISSSFGHPTVRVSCEGHETLYTDGCALEIDELLFPPLSKAEKGNEPILALLLALTEPIANALTYMKTRGLLGTNSPIILIIEDRRHDELPNIKVEIGSPYSEGDHLPSSHGLVIATRVNDLTGLARIGEGTVRQIEKRPYYFVPVYLHPQMLAQRLEEINDDSTEKTKAAHHR